MNIFDFIFRALVIYAILGTACAFGSVLADSKLKGILFSFFGWPRIAWYGLRLLIERVKG